MFLQYLVRSLFGKKENRSYIISQGTTDMSNSRIDILVKGKTNVNRMIRVFQIVEKIMRKIKRERVRECK